MAQSNNSIKKILTVAFALCIVCSVIVSTAAVALRPMQQLNVELDRKTNILRVANLHEPGIDVEAAFAEITPRVVDMRTGEYTDEFDAETFDHFQAARDPATGRTLSGDRDIAGLTRVENFATVYLVGDPENPDQIILPIRGQGLWGLMRGYMSIEGDGNTIVGITYYEHSETPGLGAEVNNPRWQAQWEGKRIFADEESVTPAIRVARGSGTGDHQVDGLSGATLTANGVTNMLQFWLSPEGFGEYLARFRTGVEPEEAQEADVELEAEA
ncbi:MULTISPECIES: Na(+)-translocating NADH-quinone reductase subunit C [Halomonadaceae]|jgi:Na+-transporting NADH:ubiquinone oxidoreductase subunit C|uniref:Na(+)-translocating NADH-quinone reductase subunit C n=1 Tax=Billgrantia aerodenitrificans TaxID=2733483 RepID=A0ABS9AWA6_9GAMM|nr:MULTISPECIES: Na(+)-translocating NADH-quinone reductase subunit C [Halomonas]MCE8025908.1 Na(+)-translocating NADH-quinone reductase subunit C [Halomonas aerodenitrificans]MCE8037273.1 Na(+)-translocating NADH-quinone reductase subunit C [Halomonas sp. MCCC 1A11062]